MIYKNVSSCMYVHVLIAAFVLGALLSAFGVAAEYMRNDELWGASKYMYWHQAEIVLLFVTAALTYLLYIHQIATN